ncbi:BspA family leucine-rich repeat surface protein [Helicobacter cynogastricus]|uniref:BspA family leucine-rich repeat surface protein n=1 Tax=Helicobacter cynogastricus TaxID=329937 RepID=UPI000CF030E1|nr:BspA family leucine-rich repeat surface protein [Helicobacter cynogastricus]
MFFTLKSFGLACLVLLPYALFGLDRHVFVPRTKAHLRELLKNPKISLSKINTRYIKDMSYLFCLRAPLEKKGICTPYRENFSGIETWDVSHVENMEGMFMNQVRFNRSLKRWNTSHVKNFSYMFANATSFNQPLNSWNTSRGVDFSYMFANATSFNQPLNSWNTSRGVDFSYMFYQAKSFNQPLNRWNRWQRNNTTPQKFSYMFANATQFKQNVRMWKDLENAQTQGMFLGTKVKPLPSLSQNTPPNLLKFLHYPKNKQELIALLKDPTIPLESINTGLIEDMSYLFCDKESIYTRLKQLPIKNGSLWATRDSEYNQILEFYNHCSTLENRTNLEGIETWDVSHVKNMEAMFMGRKVEVSLNNWDTSSVINMKAAFAFTTFNQPLDAWEMQHVQDSSFMFYGSRDFNQSLNDWDVSHIQNMSYMFSLTYHFNGNITAWKPMSATNLQGMFKYATAFNQPIGSWNVSHVSNMSYLFYGAFVFNQPLNTWNVSHVTDMQKMFFYAKSFNQDISNWNIQKVTNMYKMFAYAQSFNQDLSRWHLDQANAQCMFFHASGMKTFVATYNLNCT